MNTKTQSFGRSVTLDEHLFPHLYALVHILNHSEGAPKVDMPLRIPYDKLPLVDRVDVFLRERPFSEVCLYATGNFLVHGFEETNDFMKFLGAVA